MPKPVFLLVPGAWHSSDYYGKVIASLKAHGYEYATVTLPSVGASTYDFTEDATAIREGASELVEEGHDVVVVAHSYSGLPTGQLPQSLSKAEREKNDLKGGIIRLVFIVAYMVPEGFQAAPRDDITTLFAFMEPDTEVGETFRPMSILPQAIQLRHHSSDKILIHSDRPA